MGHETIISVRYNRERNIMLPHHLLHVSLGEFMNLPCFFCCKKQSLLAIGPLSPISYYAPSWTFVKFSQNPWLFSQTSIMPYAIVLSLHMLSNVHFLPKNKSKKLLMYFAMSNFIVGYQYIIFKSKYIFVLPRCTKYVDL